MDIVDCIMDIKEFTASIEYQQFEKDKMRKLAVERLLEIIGQAANKISSETQNILKGIPWRDIIGLRNKLAHDYGEILAERIWVMTKKPLSELLSELKKIEEIKKHLYSKNNI